MTDEQRRRLRKHCREHRAIAEEWRARGYGYPPPAYPPMPDDLRALVCGAMTRKGRPCRGTAVYANGRCKFHGGLSTGPRTEAGKAASLANLAKRWASRNPVEAS